MEIMEIDISQIAGMIDHTELKSSSGQKKIKNLCDEAKSFGFFSVCINPYNVKFVSEQLKGSNVETCSVVGFPLGANKSKLKALETEEAVRDGATEIDMVINIGALRDKNYDFVKNDIREVVKASGSSLVKVIFETCYLTDEQIVTACELSVNGSISGLQISE